MKYYDLPDKWKTKIREMLEEIREERRSFYCRYKNKVRKKDIIL